jgi:protein involved in polysaccharide export with SLBB domain
MMAAIPAAMAFGVVLRAQDGRPRSAPARRPDPRVDLIRHAEELIKPLPLEPIPDDPPPHEGAMIGIAHRIQPPDLILVEVLEALPGRPISGERLVRPDGTVDLGFYGEVQVAGLTEKQVKTKVVLHLRNYLIDRTLGLIRFDETGRGLDPSRQPIELPEEGLPPPQLPGDLGSELPPLPRSPGDEAGKTAARRYFNRPGDAGPRRRRPAPVRTPPRPPAKREEPAHPDAAAEPEPLPPSTGGGRYVPVDPADSRSVFVCLSAYNSQVYYLVGEFGSPGRLTATGYDTVFDAINFGGGVLPLVGDRHNIQLHRPARGRQPAKTFHIDLGAIERGDRTANLQIFPSDRLVIGRKADLPPR